MSAQGDLWKLLTGRLGQWVPRDDINFTGGEAADRRMREISEMVVRSGRYLLEDRKDARGRKEFRLTERTAPETEAEKVERNSWACVKCGGAPWSMASTQASMDPRWRLGRCMACRTKRTTFERTKEAAHG